MTKSSSLSSLVFWMSASRIFLCLLLSLVALPLARSFLVIPNDLSRDSLLTRPSLFQESASFSPSVLPYHFSTFASTSTTSLWMGQRSKRIRREKRRAARAPTPPRIPTPYGPIRLPAQPSVLVCDTCKGRGVIRCPVCEGRGVIRATGTRPRNTLPTPRAKLVGSRWTAVEVRHGHRHHTIVEVRGGGSKKKKKNSNNNNSNDESPTAVPPPQVRMRNCCGATHDFWIPMDELKNKMVWRMGWQTLEQIRQAEGGPLRDARLCFRCKGERILQCVDCDGQGQKPSYEPLHN